MWLQFNQWQHLTVILFLYTRSIQLLRGLLLSIVYLLPCWLFSYYSSVEDFQYRRFPICQFYMTSYQRSRFQIKIAPICVVLNYKCSINTIYIDTIRFNSCPLAFTFTHTHTHVFDVCGKRKHTIRKIQLKMKRDNTYAMTYYTPHYTHGLQKFLSKSLN